MSCEEVEIEPPNPKPAWTIADAKARLSEILRLVEEQGPQRIGIKTTYVIVAEKDWKSNPATVKPPEDQLPLGKWLVENMPRGTDFEIPRERNSNRSIPFVDEIDD